VPWAGMKQALGLKAKALSPTPRLGSGVGAIYGYRHSKATRKPLAGHLQASSTGGVLVFASYSLRILLVFSLLFPVETFAAPRRRRQLAERQALGKFDRPGRIAA
jgi:hypothetical protein